ncbi:hypothetical protein F8M41_011102 [Gigaspora margarita]|uniref:Uncharacterized protein n=1 Tax=Gigaspora margarita TaxID=4874 RepID=A0A8H4AU78_GIGMA|nr:hypothetical protein F8M41_011102 [Gigaspora margarita]
MDINSLINHKSDNIHADYKLEDSASINCKHTLINSGSIDELNHEPVYELSSDNTIREKSSKDNYNEILDEILSNNTANNKDPDNNLLSSIIINLKNDNDESEQKVCLITEQLKVNKIIHSILPMEYPPTSEDEIAIVYNIEAWNNNSEAFMSIIQYKLGRPLDMDIDLSQLTNKSLDIQQTKEAKTYIKYLALVNGNQASSFNNGKCNGNFVVRKLSKLNSNSKEHALLDVQNGFLYKSSDNTYQEEKITRMNCNVKFHKIIPLDLKATLYIILVCKGVHSHPPPPPQEVLLEILNKLKILIESSTEQFVDITARKLISNNLIKATFGTNYLSEVHASLNNIDKLRRLVAKVQKFKTSIWSRHIMIICMSEAQAKAWLKLYYFEIALFFK